MHILREYYNLCAEILKEDLTLVPPMFISNAKTYNGQIEMIGNRIDCIKLSKYNLGSGFALEDEDVEQIVETICHEFAHITIWNHSIEHSNLTRKYIKKVVNKIELKSSIYYWAKELRASNF